MFKYIYHFNFFKQPSEILSEVDVGNCVAQNLQPNNN